MTAHQNHETRYYLVETNYVGPNQSDESHIDARTVEIRTTPALGNASGEPVLDGWAGTTNDWAVYGRGDYATIEAAREAIKAQFGDVRDSTPDGDLFESNEDDVVEVYRLGKYAPLGAAETSDWLDDVMQEHITAATTDARIDELVSDWESAANCDGYKLTDSRDAVVRYRQDLRNELAAD